MHAPMLIKRYCVPHACPSNHMLRHLQNAVEKMRVRLNAMGLLTDSNSNAASTSSSTDAAPTAAAAAAAAAEAAVAADVAAAATADTTPRSSADVTAGGNGGAAAAPSPAAAREPTATAAMASPHPPLPMDSDSPLQAPLAVTVDDPYAATPTWQSHPGSEALSTPGMAQSPPPLLPRLTQVLSPHALQGAAAMAASGGDASVAFLQASQVSMS
jgi:hypothetical protein